LFTDSHIAYDLIYNPEETQFLRQAKAKRCYHENGYDMVYQAENHGKFGISSSLSKTFTSTYHFIRAMGPKLGFMIEFKL
jgi:shikimate 5-dehydrogenase